MAEIQYPRYDISRPHTVIKTDTSNLSGTASDSEKVLCLIGKAEGGKPNTVYEIKNITFARSIFRSGELMDAIELAWTGSPDATAGTILAMRLENAEASQLTTTGVKVLSKIYGTVSNNISVALEDNTISDSKRLKVNFPDDNRFEVYDNLGNIFQIQYTGDEGTAFYSVVKDPETHKSTKLVLTVGSKIDAEEAKKGNVVLGATQAEDPENVEVDAGEESANVTANHVASSGEGRIAKVYDLAKTYTDANSLISDINNLPDFEVKVSPFGDKNVDTTTLDEATNVSVKGDFVYLKAIFGDIKLQTEYSDLVAFEEVQGEQIEAFDEVALSGGSNGDPVTTWSDKFAKFANEGGYYLVPLTDKESVHAEAGHFVKERSDIGEPMRAIVGGGFKESKEKLLARVSGLKSNPRVMLIASSGEFSMQDGRALHVPAYLMASAIGGLATGLDIGESITFKRLFLNNLDIVLDGTGLDQLNDNGIVPIEFVRSRTETFFRIVNDITTYNDKSDPVKQEMSVGEANDFLVSELKVKLDSRFIGTRTFATSASLIKDFLIGFLNEKVADQEIQSFEAEEIQVSVIGNQAQIAMTVYPIRSFKQITVSLVYKQQALQA